MSNRHITKEQFSAGTTVDGSRLEKAYTDVQDHFNDLPLSSIPHLVQNQITWNTFTPIFVQTGNNAYPHSGYYHLLFQHPWKKYPIDGLRNRDEYYDTGNFDLQNKETYKGVGTNSELNPQVADESYKFAWEQTFRTDKPIIIKELTYLVMADAGYISDGVGGYNSFWGQYPNPPSADSGRAYYPNLFADSNSTPAVDISSQFQALICVDNSLNLDNTDKMSKEAHIFNVSASSFAGDPAFRPTDGDGGMNSGKWFDPAYCGEQFIEAYPRTSPGFSQEVFCVPAGLIVKFRNVMLPVHRGAKVRVVFVMPEGLFNEWNIASSETSGLSPVGANIWNCGMTILEELERK